jgi:hypothetical protein
MGKIADFDHVYINGKLVGSTVKANVDNNLGDSYSNSEVIIYRKFT